MSENTILYVKLMSGEELLGEFVDRNQDTYTLKNLIALQFVPNDSGQIGIQLIPFPLGIDEGTNIDFLVSGMAFLPLTPGQELLNAYNSKYGSGLQIVKNPGILHS